MDHSQIERLRAMKFGGKLDLWDRNKGLNFWMTKLSINTIFNDLLTTLGLNFQCLHYCFCTYLYGHNYYQNYYQYYYDLRNHNLISFHLKKLLIRLLWLIHKRTKWTPNYPELYILTKLPGVIILAYILKLY